MKLRLKSIMLIGLLVLGMSLAFSTSTQVTAQDSTVSIGLLTPKTGALGFLGQSFEDGATLAVSDLNAMDSDFTFELVVEDTATDADTTTTATTSLVTAGVSGIVGAAASSNTLAAAPIAEANEIPLVSYASTSPDISELEDGDFVFRVVPSDFFQGQAAAALAEDEGITNIAILALNDAYGQGLAGAFTSAFSGDVATTQSYPSDQDDFSSEVSAIASSDANGILLISFNTDGAAILDEIASSNLNLPIIGTDGIKSSGVFDAVSDTVNFDGVKGTAPLVASDATFTSAFNAEFGYDPSIFVPEAYDATMIIGKAAIEAASSESCEVTDELRTIGTDYDGVSSTITFDSNGDQVAASYEFWEADYSVASNFTQFDTYDLPPGAGADGPVPETHCASAEGGFLPINFGFALAAMALAAGVTTVMRRKN